MFALLQGQVCSWHLNQTNYIEQVYVRKLPERCTNKALYMYVAESWEVLELMEYNYMI